MDYFGCKNNHFSILKKKMRKIQEILGDFSKKIAGYRTPNFEKFRKFVNKNAIKRGR